MTVAAHPVIESDVRRVWGAVRFVDAASASTIESPLDVRAPGARWRRNPSHLHVLTQLDAPPVRRAEFEARESAFEPVPPVAPLALSVQVSDPAGHYLPRAFQLDLPRADLPAGPQAPRFQALQVVLDAASAAPLLPTWAVLRISLRHNGQSAPQAALRLQRPGGGAVLGRGSSDARGEALVVAAGIPMLSAGAGALVVQREVDAELVISFDPVADPAVPIDPDALALRAGVVRLTVAHRLASGRIDTLHIDLP